MPENRRSALWAPAAERDADDIWDYYSLNASADVAIKMINKIEAAADRVAAHPFHGRSRNDVRPGLRSVLVHPYIIFYRVGRGEVEIVRVLHERRNLSAIFRDEGNAD